MMTTRTVQKGLKKEKNVCGLESDMPCLSKAKTQKKRAKTAMCMVTRPICLETARSLPLAYGRLADASS